jgi:SAM-dependent methyltransferase
MKVSLKRYRILARHLGRTLRDRCKFKLGNMASDNGSTHSHFSAKQSVKYIQTVFHDYLDYGQISAVDLRGRSILELGPGDNLGVALMFLAAGASRVVCVDKFRSNADDARQQEIYSHLRATLTKDERAAFDEIVSLSEGTRFNEGKLYYMYGHGCEHVDRIFPPSSFDYIVSRAVLEELSDVEEAFDSLDKVLRPGGSQIHKIDLRDYGVFSNHGFDPLEFLTVSDFIYDLCIGFGHPNRLRLGAYKAKLGRLNYSITTYVTHFTGTADEIVPHRLEPISKEDYTKEAITILSHIRPRLTNRFSCLSNEDLLVAGVFLVARKPG